MSNARNTYRSTTALFRWFDSLFQLFIPELSPVDVITCRDLRLPLGSACARDAGSGKGERRKNVHQICISESLLSPVCSMKLHPEKNLTHTSLALAWK